MGVALIIMAGGRGERFWPRSREDRPKQFLSFDGERTLLQRTVDRVSGVYSPEQVWVVTREDYAPLVYEQLPCVPHNQVLLEPEGRDTAPCVALASLFVQQQDPDAVVVVLPADHLVLQEERFREVINHAVGVAQETGGLVTLGIQPTRPETGYGYIHVGDEVNKGSNTPVHRVIGFKEKPSLSQAVHYLQMGNYLWNSGIFICKVSSILKELRLHLPSLMEPLDTIWQSGSESLRARVGQVYPKLVRISLDYGVMEKSASTLVIPADFGWDDLGTWASLERVKSSDSEGNILAGRVLPVETRDSILYSTSGDKLLVTFGVSDLVVVETEDVTLVAHKDQVAEMKRVVDKIESTGLGVYLRSRTEEEALNTGSDGKPSDT